MAAFVFVGALAVITAVVCGSWERAQQTFFRINAPRGVPFNRRWIEPATFWAEHEGLAPVRLGEGRSARFGAHGELWWFPTRHELVVEGRRPTPGYWPTKRASGRETYLPPKVPSVADVIRYRVRPCADEATARAAVERAAGDLDVLFPPRLDPRRPVAR